IRPIGFMRHPLDRIHYTFQRNLQDFAVIKSKFRRATSRAPFNIRSIISRAPIAGLIEDGTKGDAYRMPSPIATRVAKRADLFKFYIAQAGLFPQFPGGSVLESFILINESTWERPQSFERFLATFNEQHLQSSLEPVKEHNINSDSWTRILVTKLPGSFPGCFRHKT